MKIRQGFVSNSSSSSFTCDICKETESGWDLGLQEAEMWQCKSGHTFCESHTDRDISDRGWSWEKKKIILLEYFKDWKKEEGEKLSRIETEELFEDHYNGWWEDYWREYYGELRYECPKDFCPLCNFSDVSDRDLIAYFLKNKGGAWRPELVEYLADRFETYDKFKEYIK